MGTSRVTVEYVRQGYGAEWMVVERLTTDDAREVAYAFGANDAVYDELMQAADEADRLNGKAAR